MKLFASYGQPEILHSDQGQNFQSAILKQTLDAFGIDKSCTTAYHPQGHSLVERFNRSLLQLLRAYVDKQTSTVVGPVLDQYCGRTNRPVPVVGTGNSTYHWYCMHIAHQYIHPQVWPLLLSCLVDSPNALTTLVQQLLTETPIQPICVLSWQSYGT